MNWKTVLFIILLLLLVGQIISLAGISWTADDPEYEQGRLVGKIIIITGLAIGMITLYIQRDKK